MSIIEVKHLTKKYDQHLAVNDISFSVEEGELFALLGENGAGKSTTIHILCTILKKNQGDVCICGYTLGKDDDEIRKNIGIVFQNSVLDPKLSVQENLMTRGSFYGMKKVEIQRRLAEFETYFEMRSLWKKPYGTLSGGQKRRVDICRSLIHD
ncbi:MAG: ATP-binding cassette domain-containing protein, partial [Absicoccus porci]|uniref:ABC transporter ATP-binding protein n=1 Tax=Absicoccus porci TaxID=2486576 RepID=UPI002E76CD71